MLTKISNHSSDLCLRAAGTAVEEHRASLAESHSAQGTAKSPPNLLPAPPWKISTETARTGIQAAASQDRPFLGEAPAPLLLEHFLYTEALSLHPPAPLHLCGKGPDHQAATLQGAQCKYFPSPLKYLEVAHLVFRQHLKSKERKWEFQLGCLPAPRPDKQNLQNKPFSCYKNRALPFPRASSMVFHGARGGLGGCQDTRILSLGCQHCCVSQLERAPVPCPPLSADKGPWLASCTLHSPDDDQV